jgi:hypothetical protein
LQDLFASIKNLGGKKGVTVTTEKLEQHNNPEKKSKKQKK